MAAEPAKEPKAKKEKKPKPEKGAAGDGGEEEKPVDVSRLDMRIGKIVEVRVVGKWRESEGNELVVGFFLGCDFSYP